MNSELIQRLINLVRKNGDRVVLADPEGGKAIVIIDLDAYEKLAAGAAKIPSAAAVIAKEQAQQFASAYAEKTAEVSENPFKKRKAQFRVDEPIPATVASDLTDGALGDKLNRDIGTWKTAKKGPKASNALEDEERFYLEPIE